MKNVILVSAIIFISIISGCSSKNECKSFRTGKFKLVSDVGTEYFIERNDSIQIETVPKRGTRSEFRTYWESDCQYSLLLTKGRQELMDYWNSRKLYIGITETFENGYRFDSWFEGENRIDSDTMWLVD